MENFYKCSISESLNLLSSKKSGLSKNEAETRLPQAKEFALQNEKHSSFLSKFLTQIKDLMILILLVSGVVSIVIGIIEKASSEIVDGSIILGIVVMNALFGVFQECKSEKAVDSLKKISQPQTLVLRDGQILKIKTDEIVLGDVVCLQAGSIVPADLRLIESSNLAINESTLTGESKASKKYADSLYEKDVALADRKNIAYGGSAVESGHAKGVVFAIGKESEIGKIAQSLKETKKELTPLQKNIQSVGKILTYIILLMAAVAFVLETISNPNQILRSFLTAVAISVAAIPESMPAVITIIMSLGISKLSKQKTIVKHMPAVETLGSCDVICSDKTGTITQNCMKVEKFFTFFEKNGKNFDIFLKTMILCNDCFVGEKDFVGGATEIALVKFAQSQGLSKTELDKIYPRVDEIGFSSERKMMSTLNDVDGTKVCFVKGALDRVLSKCEFYLDNVTIRPLDDQVKQKIMRENKLMCDDALRVISFAFKTNNSQKIDESGLIFLGLCGLQDPPRPEIFKAVEDCKKAHMRPIMITGDFKDTAFAIAKKVGIATRVDQVISGQELDGYSDEEFLKIVETKCVFARVSPTHKVKIVEALKKCGHIVAMTGDGVNDAPSLKKADIGIGMGKSGTDVVKDVADILITDDNFATIIIAVKEGRKIYSNIQKTIKYLFSANMAEILALFFISIIFPGKTFLLPVQILFVNLITDSLPAIALGVEPVEESVMYEKPRSKNQTLFSNGQGVSILILGAIQTILTLSAYCYGLFVHNEQIAITMAFYTLNFIQLFYMFTARTKGSCFKTNPFKNKFFNAALFVGFGLLALMIFTDLGSLLKLQPLSLGCWLVVLSLSISIIFIGEIYKLIENKTRKQKLH